MRPVLLILVDWLEWLGCCVSSSESGNQTFSLFFWVFFLFVVPAWPVFRWALSFPEFGNGTFSLFLPVLFLISGWTFGDLSLPFWFVGFLFSGVSVRICVLPCVLLCLGFGPCTTFGYDRMSLGRIIGGSEGCPGCWMATIAAAADGTDSVAAAMAGTDKTGATDDSVK